MSIGLGGALFLVFLVLKLTHVIDWSWLWVTCPLWAGVVLAIPFFIIAALSQRSVSKKFDAYSDSITRRRSR